MESTESVMNKSLEKFIAEVNRCGNASYEIGLNEHGDVVGSLQATFHFNKAGWKYITHGKDSYRMLTLYGNGTGKNQDKLRIRNVISAELLRNNEFGAV